MFKALHELIQVLRERFGDRLQDRDFIIMHSSENIKIHIPFKEGDKLCAFMGVLIFDQNEYDILLDDALKQIDVMVAGFEDKTGY